MNLITVLAVLALMPLFQAANPACLLHLTHHCPHLLSDRQLPPPPYPLLFVFYLSIRIGATVFDILKIIVGDLSLAVLVANISIGLLIDMLDTCQDLTLMLVTGCAASYLAGLVAKMTTLSNESKDERRLRDLVLSTLEVECPTQYFTDIPATN